mmetsp:Transcript_53019/g.152773  ORF Transcript_53019/g.152773 Transcript_53019/m.152773 type:complete len:206 (-) Transcript_53019:203-820(-)
MWSPRASKPHMSADPAGNSSWPPKAAASSPDAARSALGALPAPRPAPLPGAAAVGGVIGGWPACNTFSCGPMANGMRNICLVLTFSKVDPYVRAPSSCAHVGTGRRTCCVNKRTSYALAVTDACMDNQTDINKYMNAPPKQSVWQPMSQVGVPAAIRPSQKAMTQKPSCTAFTMRYVSIFTEVRPMISFTSSRHNSACLIRKSMI